jgi:hypothetical protein
MQLTCQQRVEPNARIPAPSRTHSDRKVRRPRRRNHLARARFLYRDDVPADTRAVQQPRRTSTSRGRLALLRAGPAGAGAACRSADSLRYDSVHAAHLPLKHLHVQQFTPSVHASPLESQSPKPPRTAASSAAESGLLRGGSVPNEIRGFLVVICSSGMCFTWLNQPLEPGFRSSAQAPTSGTGPQTAEFLGAARQRPSSQYQLRKQNKPKQQSQSSVQALCFWAQPPNTSTISAWVRGLLRRGSSSNEIRG